MWALKSCPRCNGDVYIEKDGHSRHCLQCGYSDDGTALFSHQAVMRPMLRRREPALPMPKRK